MNENEFILQDRLGVIRDTINKYGEDKFYIAYSGGKDSTIVHHLVDMALPNNQIPRIYTNTGIEFTSMVKFVERERESDNRIVIIKPTKNIKEMLEEKGYPFKSKLHSQKVSEYQLNHIVFPYLERYLKGTNIDGTPSMYKCPLKLLYQFETKEGEQELKVSNKCCFELKKKPSHKWAKENKKTICITGMRKEEGGARGQLTCLTNNGTKFHPLVPITNEWEEWFISKYNIELCELYYEPFNFVRTGCKGCPYAFDLQEQLETMERLLPNERKQCEIIWKPVYEEYRKVGYRLSKNEEIKLF